MEPAFILSSLLIILDGFWGIHVLVIDPLIIAIRVALPLDQVLALLHSSIVAYV